MLLPNLGHLGAGLANDAADEQAFLVSCNGEASTVIACAGIGLETFSLEVFDTNGIALCGKFEPYIWR